MNVTINLTEKDIADIIGEKYKVPVSQIIVNAEKQTVGYGPGEHEEYVATATVTLSVSEMCERGWM